MSTPFGAELSIQKRKMQVHLTKKRQCVRCRRAYIEAENLGRWQCPAYHPLEAAPRTAMGTYACCGRSTGMAGCVGADHIDDKLRSGADRMVTRDTELCDDVTPEDALMLAALTHASVLDVKQASWQFDKKTSFYRVPRADLAARKRALHRMTTE
jgi:ribosomal protein S27AE